MLTTFPEVTLTDKTLQLPMVSLVGNLRFEILLLDVELQGLSQIEIRVSF